MGFNSGFKGLNKEAACRLFSVAFIISVSSFSPPPLVTSKGAPISQLHQRSDNGDLRSFGLHSNGTLILPVLWYGLPKRDSVGREVRQPRLGQSWCLHHQDIKLPSRWMYGWKALRNASRSATFLSNRLFLHLVTDPTYKVLTTLYIYIYILSLFFCIQLMWD